MKKIYSKIKKNKTREEALKQFRKTRKKLKEDHPELLDKIQRLYNEQQSKEKQILKAADNPDEIIVDKSKNIETVLKFMELSESKDIQNHLRSILSGSIH